MQFALRCKSEMVTTLRNISHHKVQTKHYFASFFHSKVLIWGSLWGCFFLYFNSNNKADCQIKEVVDTALSVYMNDHNSVQPAAAQISKKCTH